MKNSQIRGLKEEATSRAARAHNLELALRSKDREVARAREEKEAVRAAERERSKVSCSHVGGKNGLNLYQAGYRAQSELGVLPD